MYHITLIYVTLTKPSSIPCLLWHPYKLVYYMLPASQFLAVTMLTKILQRDWCLEDVTENTVPRSISLTMKCLRTLRCSLSVSSGMGSMITSLCQGRAPQLKSLMMMVGSKCVCRCCLVDWLLYTVITVGFSQTEYQVEENGGLIRVCAELMTNSTSCVVPFSFFLTFTTQDGTG